MDPIANHDAKGARAASPFAHALVGHRLGPVVYCRRCVNVLHARLIALAGLLGCTALLAAAAWLEPDRAGHGTHTQLGLPQCSMLTITGLPCPTCGMTTAFAHTVRGACLQAFRAQPAGMLLALATIGVVPLLLHTLVRGTVWTVNWYRVSPTHVVMGGFALLLAAWAFRIGVHLTTTAPLVP